MSNRGTGLVDVLRDQWCSVRSFDMSESQMVAGYKAAVDILTEIQGRPAIPAEALLLATSPLFDEAYRGTMPLYIMDNCYQGEKTHIPHRVNRQAQLRLDLFYCAATYLNELGVFPKVTYQYTVKGPRVSVPNSSSTKSDSKSTEDVTLVAPRQRTEEGNLPYTLPRANVLVSASKQGERILYAVHTADEPVLCEVPLKHHFKLAFLNTVSHLLGTKLKIPFFHPKVYKNWSTRSVHDIKDVADDPPRGLIKLDQFFLQELCVCFRDDRQIQPQR